MPRETKSQKEACHAAEKAANEHLDRTQYSTLLMNALETVTSDEFNFELVVQDGMFVIHNHATGWGERYKLAPIYTPDSQNSLDTLRRTIDLQAEERARTFAEEQAKKIALAKLTAEERRLLGV